MLLGICAFAQAGLNRESPAQFENRIKPWVSVRRIVVLCTKKLHFVSRNWRKEK